MKSRSSFLLAAPFLFFVLLLIFVFSFAQAQNIRVTVIGTPDSVVSVYYPTGGINYYWWKNGSPKALNKDYSASFTNTLTKSANVYVSTGKRYENVFVEPGEEVTLKADYSNKKKLLVFEGRNAVGNLLLSSLNRTFYQQKARAYFKKDSTVAGIWKGVRQDMDKETLQFDSLMKLKQITPAFYKYAVTGVKYYYASVYGAAIYNDYYRTRYNPKHPEYKAVMHPDYVKAWPEVYKLFSVNNPDALVTEDFYAFASDYVLWYKVAYARGTSVVKLEEMTPQNRHQINYAAFEANFTGPVLEYLLAHYIFDEAMQKDFNPELLKLFVKFTHRFPQSKYTVFLTPLTDEIMAYQTKSLQPSADQVILDEAFLDFDDVLAAFKDKTVYVDLWATWCGPCKAEFEFNPGLKAHLKARDMEILYLSMDKDAVDKQWREMIRYYGLGGNHIRTNDKLRQDIINRFYDGKGYSIPRYMLIKNGKILNDAALQPSDKDKLYQQIDRLIGAR